MNFLHYISMGIGILGAVVITYGVLRGLISFVVVECRTFRGQSVEQERKKLRHALGYYLLLGLEFLIAADIIETLMEPDAQRLIILGAIVAVRTVISFSLQFELRRDRENRVASSDGSAEIKSNPPLSP